MFGSTPSGTTPSGGRGRLALALYEIPASETPEGQARLRAYFEALGRFVDMFSTAETSCYFVLQYYAKMPSDTAKALLSGVRTEEVQNRLTRLADIGVMPAEALADLKPTLDHLHDINTCRNLILHHGATEIAEGRGHVTDAERALTPDRARSFPVSPDILAEMTADLEKIIVHLRARHSGLPELTSKILRDGIAQRLSEPWRYTPPPTLHPKSQKSGPKGPPKG